MADKEKKFKWAKQKKGKDLELIMCPKYDTYKDFKMDPSGHYVLVRVDFEYYRIEVSICNKAHEIIKVFVGQTPQDIYHEIFRYEKQHNFSWFTSKDHIAYLGKELKKAEMALVSGNGGYFQE